MIVDFCRDVAEKEDKVLDDIRKCTDSFSINNVEQTAYFRAMGDKNQLNMDKYRDQVQQELEKKSAANSKRNK